MSGLNGSSSGKPWVLNGPPLLPQFLLLIMSSIQGKFARNYVVLLPRKHTPASDIGMASASSASA
jgi:hypothetical protein